MMVPPPMRMDVLVEGAGVRRSVDVQAGPEELVCEGLRVPYTEIFWISRRAGMLLVFGTEVTLAARGAAADVARLHQALSDRIDLAERHQRIVRRLGHEVVLFTAGCAVAGTIEGRKIGGLFVVAATRRALHLLSGDRQHAIVWPVKAARRRAARSSRAADGSLADYLVLGRGETSLTVRYLFPEEIGAVLHAASREPPSRPEGRPLEMFSRGQVSPPTPAELPEFSLAAGSLPQVAERAAANVPGELATRALLPPDFFKAHFLELGEIALGPLLLRKSAAAAAGSLRKAVRAMNASGLQEDTRAAVETAADRMIAVYEAECERLAGRQRGSPRADRGPSLPEERRAEIAARMQAPFERLWTRFEGLTEQQETLLTRLAEYEEGPPGEDDGEVLELAEEWRSTMSRLDRGYEGAWRELVEEIEKTWSTELLPRLVRTAAPPSRAVPEWVQLVALALITLFLAVAVVLLLIV